MITEPAAPVRRFREADARTLARHANDRDVWRHLRDRFPHPYTDADAAWWVSHAMSTVPTTDFAIELGGEAVGGIGVVPGTDIERVSAEVGYWLGRSAWGQGLATAALRSLTTFLFDTTEVQRLFATPFEDNPASIRVLEKAGFSRERVLRSAVIKDGQLKNLVMYARLRSDG